MTNNVLLLWIATWTRKGALQALPRIRCRPCDDSFPIPGFKHVQFSILAFFAITSNKAQGKHFWEKKGIDLREDAVSRELLYVTLCQATDLSNIVVLSKIEDWKTNNIAYPEIISTILLALSGILSWHVVMLYGAGLGRFHLWPNMMNKWNA